MHLVYSSLPCHESVQALGKEFFHILSKLFEFLGGESKNLKLMAALHLYHIIRKTESHF